MKKIAITGSIGSGKSTVSRYLSSLDFPVADSDAIVAELYRTHQEVKETLVLWYGESILKHDAVDKGRLKEILLSDPSQKHRIEELVHPQVKASIHEFFNLHRQAEIVFCEVPLLFEVGWEDEFDETWLIVSSKEDVISRLQTSRQMDVLAIEKMLKLQMPVEVKKQKASVILENHGSFEELKHTVEAQLKIIRGDKT